MKTAILVLCLTAFVVAADRKYDDSFDDIDLSDVLNNERLLVAYTNCLIDKGPCTAEVKQLKEKLPEALETNCAKCTDKQKTVGKKLVHELKAKHPDLWQKLVAKYDPTGKYHKAFEDFLKN
ncbi:allergen Tha p 1-like [Choristoneura fumiferana]|uniref:allergen Tha p 1-like n=1 Tax=Choristoneura fumiferana TaxID=7141 RepID=UPI003D154B97